MAARRSTTSDIAATGRAKTAREPPTSVSLQGNSETRLTPGELEHMVLSLLPHEAGLGAPAIIETAWEHGRVMSDADPAMWRQDACGAWMHRAQFGVEQEFGWKIVNISRSNEHIAAHLRPFHWRNDFDIANGEPHCRVTSDRSGVPAGEQVRPPRNHGA